MLLSEKANKFEITWFCFLKVEGHSIHAVNFPRRVVIDRIEAEFKRTGLMKAKWPPGQKSRLVLLMMAKDCFKALCLYALYSDLTGNVIWVC